ncbi:MAG: cell division protein ZipA C-terminal FtsZ-binding domain-containing protein [Candidatus Thiodiazotropha sp.]
MDATTLRIVLLVLGLVFLAAIYLYETRRRKRDSAQAKRRVAPEMREPELKDYPEFDARERSRDGHDPQHEDDTWVNWDEDETEPLRDGEDYVSEMHADDEPDTELELENDDAFVMPEQQELFGFSAQEASPVDVPKLIIQINIKSKSEPFPGLDIHKAMLETGMVMGKLNIYQRLAAGDQQHPQFNLASMVEPGVFPGKEKDLAGFATPGLTLFTQLPVPGDSMAVFSDMLFTAERLAAILGGELQDETHSALTKQTIEHLRGQIMEHRRQVQLARSKA